MSSALPRRELNRAHTWQAIHESASSLVLRDGLAAATVEAISDQADISRRTFFNYFATKEDAVLGLRQAQLSEQDLDAFNQPGDLLSRVVHLMRSAVASAFALDSFDERRELIRRYPELRIRIDLQMRESETLVRDAIEASPELSGEHSRALVMLAGTVVRFAFAPQPDGTIDDSPDALDSAILLFRNALKEVL